jgi:hypothetical protein
MQLTTSLLPKIQLRPKSAGVFPSSRSLNLNPSPEPQIFLQVGREPHAAVKAHEGAEKAMAYCQAEWRTSCGTTGQLETSFE